MAIKSRQKSETAEIKGVRNLFTKSEMFEVIVQTMSKDEPSPRTQIAIKDNLDISGKDGEGNIIVISLSLDYDVKNWEFSLVQKGSDPSVNTIGPLPLRELPMELQPQVVYTNAKKLSPEATSNIVDLLRDINDRMGSPKKAELPRKHR
jgi:hypothetical protein